MANQPASAGLSLTGVKNRPLMAESHATACEASAAMMVLQHERGGLVACLLRLNGKDGSPLWWV